MTKEDNYNGILLEEIRDSVKILAEGQISMRDDLAIVKSDVSTLKSDVSTLKSDVSTLKSDVSTLRNDLAGFKEETNEKFGLVMEYLSRIEDELMDIKKEINGIKDGSIPVGNMTSIEERVTFLEQEVVEMKSV